ncbi:MAG: bifunctional folylpolyglutamate synthase/dihydrofolate synthase [Chitinophagaceae bacterium]|nr:bifunctional folylpolyglutamate synthase/dihydrofolate synthase [Chitinophagaceae bacterium]
MNYEQTIEYLYTQLPMFSRVGAPAIKEGLDNTIALCKALGNPQNKIKTIHVAGTNGKGSVSHILAAVLQSAGYKTGLYTSPHLKDFRERIKINGALCSKDFVVDFVEKTKHLSESIAPSFFELTVAMAFTYFSENAIDIAIIETGLGGRLDSTNIITPELSIITNIGKDHINLLGDTLEKIAFEKAGIIKQNVPVVIGEYKTETKPVFEKVAFEKNAPLIYAQENLYVSDWKYHHHLLNITVADKLNNEKKQYLLDLTGIYQTKNILTVLEALHQLQLKNWKINDHAIFNGFQYVKKLTGLHGRWEIIHENPSVILDVAHNEDGIKQLAEQLALIDFNHLHIITGFVKDKDVPAALALLPKAANYYFTQAHIPRALPAYELAQIAVQNGLTGKVYENVNTAIKAALLQAQKNDLILVCGSVFLVGEVNE